MLESTSCAEIPVAMDESSSARDGHHLERSFGRKTAEPSRRRMICAARARQSQPPRSRAPRAELAPRDRAERSRRDLGIYLPHEAAGLLERLPLDAHRDAVAEDEHAGAPVHGRLEEELEVVAEDVRVVVDEQHLVEARREQRERLDHVGAHRAHLRRACNMRIDLAAIS